MNGTNGCKTCLDSDQQCAWWKKRENGREKLERERSALSIVPSATFELVESSERLTERPRDLGEPWECSEQRVDGG